MLKYWVLSLLTTCTLIRVIHCHESSGFTIELPDDESMCFYEDFEGSKTYNFYYKVIKGGNYDIDVTVESPTGKEIYNKKRSSEDEFEFEISWGTYKFCFSNEFSTLTHKLIYFEIRPEEHGRLAMQGGQKGPSANTLAEESLEGIHSHASDIMDYQTVHRLEEAKGRNKADLLNWCVQFFSILQAVLILVVGCFEIVVLKTFFTQKRPSSKTPLQPLTAFKP